MRSMLDCLAAPRPAGAGGIKIACPKSKTVSTAGLSRGCTACWPEAVCTSCTALIERPQEGREAMKCGVCRSVSCLESLGCRSTLCKLAQVMVFCPFLVLAGCVADTPPISGPYAISYNEVLQETLRDAVMSHKRQVATFGEYRISARPVAQVAPNCWTIHQIIHKYDRLYSEKDVSICHQGEKFYETTSSK